MDPKLIHNLKNQGSTLKGDIAEVIVQHKINFGHRPREVSPTFLDEIRNYEIPQTIKDFLRKHWYTIDIFAFVVENGKVTNLEIYEVKCTNLYDPSYVQQHRFKPKITSNSLLAYSEGMALGFKVKFAEVIFLDFWEYYICFKKFNPDDFYIYDGSTQKYLKKSTVRRF